MALPDEPRKHAAKAKAVKPPIPIKPGVVGEPYNNEAERHVLGKLFLYPEQLAIVAQILTQTDFFEVKHQLVFSAFCRVAQRDEIPTPSLIDEELKRMGKLGLVKQVYVHELLNGLHDHDDVIALARVVLEDSLQRQETGIGSELMTQTISSALAMGRLELLQQRRLNQSLATTDRAPGITIADAQRMPVQWLWHRRIARGKLTIVDGDPGIGKGFLTAEIAARVSRGWKLPDDPRGVTDPSDVLLLTPEDDVADTIRPRLEEAGADLTRVHYLATSDEIDAETGRKRERLLTIPRDIALFEETILRRGVSLWIIDPITAVLDAGVKTNNDTEVRAALMPLVSLAERTNCAIWIVRHLNKSGGENALYRGGGSIAFVGLARTGFVLSYDPDGDAKRVLAPVKTNIGKMANALAFSLVTNDEDGIPHVEWDQEPSQYDARSLLSAKRSEGQHDVIQALRDALPEPMSPKEICEAVGQPGATAEDAMRHRLRRMERANSVISCAYGKYTLPKRDI